MAMNRGLKKVLFENSQIKPFDFYEKTTSNKKERKRKRVNGKNVEEYQIL